MADVERDATVEAEKERLKLEQLRNVVHDNTRSLDERHRAIDALKEIVPGYVAEISKEGKVYDENTAALDRYIQKMKEQAMVKGAEKKIEEMGTQWAELEAQRLEQEQKERERRERNARGPQGAIPGAVGVWSNQAQEAVAEGAGQQMLNAIEKKQGELQDAMNRMGEVVKGAKEVANTSKDTTVSPTTPAGGSDTSTTTKSGGGKTENKQAAEARRRMKQEEALAKAEREKADLEAKQAYQQRLITEEDYHERRYQNQQAYIARMAQARDNAYATEAEKQEVQNMVSTVRSTKPTTSASCSRSVCSRRWR